jgi:ribose 5-phosphate isomerase B
MRVSIGCDHRGVQAKQQLVPLLRQLGHEVVDEGTQDEQSVDYPDYAARVARKVSSGEAERGILICGSGIGMAITANKFSGVRAAPCHDEGTAQVSRRHNNANVLCLAGETPEQQLARMVEVWLATPFDGGRHQRRVEKIAAIERENAARDERT